MNEKKERSIQEETTYPAQTEMVEIEENSLVIRLRKPYKFEGREYMEIDLTCMEEMTGEDMIAVNKIMSRTATGTDSMPEVSLEYACYFAARAMKMPVEFFLKLPPWAAMRVKGRVMGFLFGLD